MHSTSWKRSAAWLALAAIPATHAAPTATSDLMPSSWVHEGPAPAKRTSLLPLAPATLAFRRTAAVDAAERELAVAQRSATSGIILKLLDAQVPADGPIVVRYKSTVEGIEVYGVPTSVVLDQQMNVRAVSNAPDRPSAKADLAAFLIDDGAALDSALQLIGESANRLSARRRTQSSGAFQHYDLQPSREFSPGSARVKRIWYPAASVLSAAYYVELIGTRRGVEQPVAQAVVVSATDGSVLHHHSLIHDLHAFNYRAFATTQGFPYVDPYGLTNPHPTGTPNGYVPGTPAPMNLLSLSHAAISTGDPWLADNATDTRGNNVDAFFNGDVPDEDGYCSGLGYGPAFNADEGDFRAPLSAPWTFDYAYNVTTQSQDYFQCASEPGDPIPTASPQFRAKIVQAFYATNWLHDYFYDLGYDEVSGNSQTDNYGRGGLDNDPLIVHAGFDGTFTYAPADGESPALSLGNNSQSRTHRDVSSFDFGVMAHEWTHTVFGRLAGTHFYSGQEGALNEGIADFVGTFVMVRAEDRNAMPGPGAFNGTYAVGAYMNLDYDYRPDPLPRAGSPGFPDNSYYHGIRRFPTTFDMSKNPLTFHHISVDQPLPASWNAYDWKARSLQNSEIHTAGEIWTAAMWECSRNILTASPAAQFEATKRRILGYVVAGLKGMPLEPTYTEARNALLFAIRAHDDDDYRRCRSGFAKRGLGAGAIAPDRHSYSLRGAIESFSDSDRAVSIVDSQLIEIGGDGDGVLDRGENGQLRITVINSGLLPLTHLRLSVPAIPGFYTFPSGNEIENISLQPNQSQTFNFAVKIQGVLRSQTIFFPIGVIDTQQLEAHDFHLADFRTNYDLVRDSSVDTLLSAAGFSADWTHSFDGYPHGCAQYICSNDPEVASSFADMLDWKRTRHQGETAYKIGDPHMAIGSSLESVSFNVSASSPLRIKLRHAWDVDRQSAPATDGFADPGLATVELSVDGGDWQPASIYLASGSAAYTGASSGWRNETLDFADHLAGRRLRLRLHLVTGSSWVADDAYWAISRVAVEGASSPIFSTVHGNVN
ncbi:MAG: M36 family metallopeptidase [Tahibacter sp.]